MTIVNTSVWAGSLANGRFPMRFWATALLLVFASGLFASTEPVELPEPPEGFEWVRLPEVSGAFLKPVSWHFLAEERNGVQGYFLTKEDIQADKEFLTGLTINVIRDSLGIMHLSASDFARAFIGMAAETDDEEVIHSWESSVSTLESFGVRVRNVSDPEAPIIMHRLAIGNSATDTLHLITFESPEPEWEEAWEVGEVMLKMFLIDDEI